MTIASRLAERIAAAHGRDPWRAAERLDLAVFVEPLPEGCDEFYVEDPGSGSRALVITTGLSSSDARHLVAHGLAHHLLHVGNRLRNGRRVLWSGRHEREAEEFADRLLMSERELRELVEAIDPPALSEVALHFDVPERAVGRRIARLQRTI